jgi:hypothetical protein
MTTGHAPTGPRVELRVRSHTSGGAHEQHRELIRRLHHLEEAGAIESVTVEAWGTSVEIPVDGVQDEPANDVLEQYAEFEAWAEQNGHTLEPAFRTRTASSLLSEESWEEMIFPMFCLAVYDGDDLKAVFPCADAEGVQTVEDCLTQLETRGVQDEAADRRDRHPVSVES